MSNREVIVQVEQGYRMPKPTVIELPDDIYCLMLQCWDAIPKNRPTFENLKHFFESFSESNDKFEKFKEA